MHNSSNPPHKENTPGTQWFSIICTASEMSVFYSKNSVGFTYNNLLVVGAGGASPGMSLMSLLFGFTIWTKNTAPDRQLTCLLRCHIYIQTIKNREIKIFFPNIWLRKSYLTIQERGYNWDCKRQNRGTGNTFTTIMAITPHTIRKRNSMMHLSVATWKHIL